MNLTLFQFINIYIVYTLEYIKKNPMKFKWDEKKNQANYEKHCLWFEEAQTVWLDTTM